MNYIQIFIIYIKKKKKKVSISDSPKPKRNFEVPMYLLSERTGAMPYYPDLSHKIGWLIVNIYHRVREGVIVGRNGTEVDLSAVDKALGDHDSFNKNMSPLEFFKFMELYGWKTIRGVLGSENEK